MSGLQIMLNGCISEPKYIYMERLKFQGQWYIKNGESMAFKLHTPINENTTSPTEVHVQYLKWEFEIWHASAVDSLVDP